jgi:hypothetical protein
MAPVDAFNAAPNVVLAKVPPAGATVTGAIVLLSSQYEAEL